MFPPKQNFNARNLQKVGACSPCTDRTMRNYSVPPEPIIGGNRRMWSDDVKGHRQRISTVDDI